MVRAAKGLPPPPVRSSNPPRASPAGSAARGVWAPPRSLAATRGILSLPRGTEMFQFPRCPPATAGARPCAGRVAPFGHPRLAGCQRLPGAFRRVAASFFGRQRQGIHQTLFLRIPISVHIQHAPLRRHQTGARQRDVPHLALHHPDSTNDYRPDGPGSNPPPGIPPLREETGSMCRTYSRSLLMLRYLHAVRADDQARSLVATLRSRRPRPQNPAGSAWRIVKVHKGRGVSSGL